MAQSDIVNIFGNDLVKTGYDVLEGIASMFGQSTTLENLARTIGKKFGVNVIPTSQDILKVINKLTNGLLKTHTAEVNDLIQRINNLPLGKGGEAKYAHAERAKELQIKQKKLNEKERLINTAVDTAKTGASAIDFTSTTNKAKLANQTLSDLEQHISQIQSKGELK